MTQILKRTAKWIVSVLFCYSGLLSIVRSIRRKFLSQPDWAIITYHNIVGNDEKRRAETQPGMCVLAETFDKQMNYISHNFNVISVEALVKAIRDGRSISPNTIAVTFDDGWRDNYTEALPILKKYKVPAMIFLATDLIKSGKIPPFLEVSILLGRDNIWPRKAIRIFRAIVEKHNLKAHIPQLDEECFSLMAQNSFHYMKTLMLLDYEYMHEIVDALLNELGLDKTEWRNRRWMINTAEIREMDAFGIEFGSHGESHDLMILIEREQVKRELKRSKEYIESQLGKPIDLIAYPNGDYNDDIIKEVRAAGYIGALAMYRDEKANSLDIYSLGRIGLSEGACLGPLGNFSKAIFACKIARVL